jgi:N-acetylglucosaminyldiphosphoundecaprenol N-acetyl-beta-D-mannosaminyltransferase
MDLPRPASAAGSRTGLPDAEHRIVHVLDVPVDALTLRATVEACERAVTSAGHLDIGVVNAAKLVLMRHDEWLRRAVLDADLILPDGQSVVWASRLLREPLPERVAGIDLFVALLERAEQRGFSVYFLGATDAVLAAMMGRVHERFPGLRVCGYHNGYFSLGQSADVAADIRAVHPDLLFVGMTSPRKELFLQEWGHRVDAHVCHGVGGSFDIMAGVTRRAPDSWQRLGLEWLYRLKQEPRRLWRRYLTTNVAFLLMLTRELALRGARRGW